MTTIGHLRLHTAAHGVTVTGVRGEAEDLLATADLRPPGLSTSAVLVVRQLNGLPHFKGRTAAAPWTEAARTRITHLYRTAIHPIQGAVPASAESVLFADDAEVLACFTRDVLRQTEGTRWYWRYLRLGSAARPLLAAHPPARGSLLAAAWSAAPQALPPALAHLSLGERVAAIALLTPREVATVVHALHQSFALPDHIYAVQLPPHAAATMPQPGENRVQLSLTTDEAAPSPRAAPWESWLPAPVMHTLSPQARYLAGLSTALYHAPTFARSHVFAQRAAWWLESALVEWESSVLTTATRALPSHTAPPGTAAEPPMPTRSTTGDVSVRAADLSPAQANAPPQAAAPTGDAPPAPTTHDDPTSAQSAPDNAITWQVTLGGLPRAGEGEWTRLGGIFYLMHTLPWLALPGKWAESLSAWAMLELLARSLLRDDSYAGDPIWTLLAALDQRDPALPPGASLPDDASYTLSAQELQLAPAWVQREFEAYTTRDEGALSSRNLSPRRGLSALEARQRDPYGVTERLDLPPSRAQRAPGPRGLPSFREGLRRTPHAGRGRGSASANSSLIPHPSSLHPWLAARAPFYRSLLRRALVNETPAAMLTVRGQVSISHTHIDLYLPASAVNIAVRRAGLDADPGWSPDFGYIVLFHFVEESS